MKKKTKKVKSNSEMQVRSVQVTEERLVGYHYENNEERRYRTLVFERWAIFYGTGKKRVVKLNFETKAEAEAYMDIYLRDSKEVYDVSCEIAESNSDVANQLVELLSHLTDEHAEMAMERYELIRDRHTLPHRLADLTVHRSVQLVDEIVQLIEKYS